MHEQWNNFFVMVGSGAAATHKNRGINMLTGFTAIFMASGFSLIGDQDLRTLGFEWLVLWLIIFLIIGYRSGFYIAAVAIIVLFAFLISGAWLLMIGIYEDRAK